jgi:uncharacterized protein (TIGR03437 family)
MCSAWTAFAQPNTLIANPSSLTFCGQPGEAISAIPVSIASDAAPVTYVVAGVLSDGNWLTVHPSFASATTTPTPQLVAGVTGGLVPFVSGNYSGEIVLTGVDGTRLGAIPATLQVSAAGCGGTTHNGLLYADAGPVNLQLPPNVTSGAEFNIYNLSPADVTIIPNTSTSSSQQWLTNLVTNYTVVPGLVSPTPLGVTVNTAGLGSGSYSGNLQINSSNDTNLAIPITLNVSASAATAQFSATPSPLVLGVPRGSASTSANLKLTNLNAVATSISAAAGGAWLTVTPSSAVVSASASTTLTVSIAPAALAPGMNTGAINVQTSSGGTFSIPVQVTYGIEPEIGATPNPVNLNQAYSAAITVSSNGTAAFSASAYSAVNQPWLSVTPFNNPVAPSAPAKLAVTVQPSLLPVGPAAGFITLTPSDGSTPLTIPINVNSGTDSALVVAPAQLSFTSQPGAVVAMAPQSLALTATSAATYTVQAIAQSASNWLTVSTGTIAAGPGLPASVTVQVSPAALAIGSYSGEIVFTNRNSGAEQIVPVTLTVAGASVVPAPSSLAFTYQLGSSATPPPQTVQLTTSATTAAFTAAVAGSNGGPNFLTVTPSSGSAPGTVAIGLDPSTVSRLAAGQYTGAVTIATAAGAQAINVSLTVTQPQPAVLSIVNAASLQPGPVAPGEVVTIFGSGFPASQTGVHVSFDGFNAPVTYVGAGQINAIVPYEIAGRTITDLTVSAGGSASSPISLRVVGTSPAIFAATLPGSAAAGSVITFFATGEGLYPGAVSGAITSSQPPFPTPTAPVSVTVGGQPAQILYAGEAPGSISGLLQVNAVISPSTPSGPQTVVLQIGNNTNNTQSVMIAVQ